MKIRNLISTAACAAALITSINLSAAPVLVGNSSLDGVTLSESDMKAVLLGKKVSLNGGRVVIVVAKTSDGQENFLKDRIGKTGSQFDSHWRKLFMTGGGVAPTQVEAESDVVFTVTSTAGAVGVVDESQAGGLSVIGR